MTTKATSETPPQKIILPTATASALDARGVSIIVMTNSPASPSSSLSIPEGYTPTRVTKSTVLRLSTGSEPAATMSAYIVERCPYPAEERSAPAVWVETKPNCLAKFFDGYGGFIGLDSLGIKQPEVDGRRQAIYLCNFLFRNETNSIVDNEIYRNYQYISESCGDSHSTILRAFARGCGCSNTNMTNYLLDFKPPPKEYEPLPRWQADLVRECEGEMLIWPKGNCVSNHEISRNATEMADLCSSVGRFFSDKQPGSTGRPARQQKDTRWLFEYGNMGICKDDPIGLQRISNQGLWLL